MAAPQITRTCEYCGVLFIQHGYRSKRPRRFHSKSCASLERQVRRQRRPVTDRFWEKVNREGPIPKHRQNLDHVGSGWPAATKRVTDRSILTVRRCWPTDTPTK